MADKNEDKEQHEQELWRTITPEHIRRLVAVGVKQGGDFKFKDAVQSHACVLLMLRSLAELENFVRTGKGPQYTVHRVPYEDMPPVMNEPRQALALGDGDNARVLVGLAVRLDKDNSHCWICGGAFDVPA